MIAFLIQILQWLLKWLEGGAAPSPPPYSPAKQRVVILGGGVAGVAAAFWLTAPQQNGRYTVTLYTQGWRLGGKCASGRNHAQSDRIEEHGLHLLMGCYQNAFTTIRACYDVWHRPATHPFKTWQDAFLPQRQITLMEQDGPGEPPSWAPWNFDGFPRIPGEPGDPPQSPSATLFMRRLVLRMVKQMKAAKLPPSSVASYRAALEAGTEAIRSPAAVSTLAALEVVRNANQQLSKAQTPARPRASALSPELLTTAASGWTVTQWVVLGNLGLSILAGFLNDILGEGDAAYDALNTQDFRAWLKGYGASDTTLASAPIRAIYDLAFAFPKGDASSIDNGSMAAGVTLRFVMEIAFGYRHAPLWRMAAGTGDTVFVPLYQVLQSRGASIQFFQQVMQLRPTSDGSRIGEIDIYTQAKTVGNAPYRPLTTVGSFDCWPNQPDWTQLVNGSALSVAHTDYESSSIPPNPSITLTAGTDFDLAIVAMPPAVLQTVAAPLIAASPAWQLALSASRSVPTRALQVWMADDTPALGWTLGSTVLTSYAETLDSWGDMSAVLTYENWPANGGPQSLAYFCGCLQLPMTGPINGASMLALAVAQGQQWLDANIAALWPSAPPASGWWVAGGAAVARFDKANFDLSDLYVQTPAGNNVSRRFDPGQTAGFANLYIVGDWTKTRFSGGCFESAVESAMLAASAIGGFPGVASV